jgi:hypothetical protein
MKKPVIVVCGLLVAVLCLALLIFPEILSGLYWKCKTVQVGMTHDEVAAKMRPYQTAKFRYRETTLAQQGDKHASYLWDFFTGNNYICEIEFQGDVVSRVDSQIQMAGKFDF